jgi:anti-anti-sigma regulatory factor
VVFSLFGKKGEASKKAEKKPLAAKTSPAKPGASPAPPGAPEGSAPNSLDFSGYVPPPKAESQPPDAAPASSVQGKPAALPEQGAAPASFSSALGHSRAERVVAGVASRASVGSAPVSRAKAPEIGAGAVDPVIEEIAILFANGQADEALAKLLPAVREDRSGTSALQRWLMLFDLYQHLGRKADFEALAVQFALKFERSAPAWRELERRDDPALATGGIGYCALSGTLSEASAAALEELRGAAEKLRSIRIDFSKLEALDGPGCGLLRQTLLSIQGAGKQIVFTGEDRITRLLEELCQPGRRETDEAVWDLLLEIYRMLDLKEKFEEAAVNYAITFEVSPPSWESTAGAIPKRAPRSESIDDAGEALILSGEITGASEALAARLQEWAATRRGLSIDMSQARRVDFVTAGLMLRVLSKLQPAGLPIQISGANELINALFRVMGIDKVARIIPRR